MRRVRALQTAWSNLPWLFYLTQNIAVHPAVVEMEERNGSIMPQRPERWQAHIPCMSGRWQKMTPAEQARSRERSTIMSKSEGNNAAAALGHAASPLLAQ